MLIENSYASGSVSGDIQVGGLIGSVEDGTVTNCYSVGSVSGNEAVGGLIGVAEDGTLNNCYSVGSVSGDTNTGGLIGVTVGFNINNSTYYDSQTSGQSDDTGKGTPKTTAEMKLKTTYTEAQYQDPWDFDNIWDIGYMNGGYPSLMWQELEPELIPSHVLVMKDNKIHALESPTVLTLKNEMESVKQIISMGVSLPVASSDYRGKIFVLDGGRGADKVYICLKDDTDTYVWEEFTFLGLEP